VLKDLAVRIAHVGSTAVPGLAAKPLIDIDVLLRSVSDLPQVIAALASIGYRRRGDLGILGREAFRAPASAFPHHLYVRTEGREYGRHLAFRDYLRTHPEDAAAYASLKRELAGTLRDHREAYNNAKAEFVEKILRKASSPEMLSKLAVPSKAGSA